MQTAEAAKQLAEMERQMQERAAELARANQLLASQLAERERTEAQLRNVMSHARCLLWHADIDGLTGWQTESGQEHPFRWQLAISDEEAARRVLPLDVPAGQTYVKAWERSRHPADARRADQTSAAALRQRKASYSQEFRCHDREGRERWLFEDVYLEELGEARWHAVGVCTDITERKHAEEQREQLIREQAARAEAERANRAKDRFLAILSHELRTPLTPVLAAASALEVQADLSPEVREDIEMIRRNVELEARLINDLLDMTRIISGKLHLSMETVDVHAALHNALAICEADLQAKGLRVALDVQARDHLVHGDFTRLQQVFWNLLKNAVKFTPADGTITVRTSTPADVSRDAGSRPSSILVTVEDTGIGIAPEVLPRIFEAF